MKKQSVWQLIYISATILALLLAGIFTKQPYYKIISSILSIVMLAFLMRGSRIAFPLGMVYYSLYAFICFQEHVYGAAVLNIICTIPIQIISFFTWKRKGQKNTVLRVKTLPAKWRILSLAATVAACFGVYFILRRFGSVNPVLDAASMVFSITALVLLPLGVIEQWFFNAMGNGLGVALWASTLAANIGNINIVLVFSIFTVNSLIGMHNWWKLYRSQRVAEELNKLHGESTADKEAKRGEENA